MEIYTNLDDIKAPFPHAHVTIGNFDGVHIGHQALFHEVIDLFKKINEQIDGNEAQYEHHNIFEELKQDITFEKIHSVTEVWEIWVEQGTSRTGRQRGLLLSPLVAACTLHDPICLTCFFMVY